VNASEFWNLGLREDARHRALSQCSIEGQSLRPDADPGGKSKRAYNGNLHV